MRIRNLMFEKLYQAGLGLLFLMCTTQAMELAISGPKEFDNEAYFRVAKYLKATEHKIDEKERQRRNDFLANEENHLWGLNHASKVKKYMQSIEYLREIPEEISFSMMHPDRKKEDVRKEDAF